MLTQITIKNLAIVDALELHFDAGMHVITGETGAGKSIIIDALSLALGERTSIEQVRHGHTQAEVTACFDIRKLPPVQALIDNPEECVIRRIINVDGKSRAYINGVSVAAQQLKDLAPHLIQIHSQHQHHALLQSDMQRDILDAYANNDRLLAELKSVYDSWQATKREIEKLTSLQQHADKLNLLNYQLQELENLNLQPSEINDLNQQHKQLCNAAEITETCNSVCTQLTGDASLADQLYGHIAKLNALKVHAVGLTPGIELLEQAAISIQEASNTLEDYCTKLDLDQARLQDVEQRLNTIHNLARKLRIDPQHLYDHQQVLSQERDQLAASTENLDRLQLQLMQLQNDYQAVAANLTASRQQAATKLTQEIMQGVHQLELPHAKFVIKCDPVSIATPSAHGMDLINFMITTNPGQPLALLKKVASGGELSRISLAIQTIIAQKMAIPTLILDEVDVGISGKTAATVGSIMRDLGKHAQIVCITHLPQVAAQGHQHFKVEKLQDANSTVSLIKPLSRSERVQELARLLGGLSVTPEAIANAERLLVVD